MNEANVYRGLLFTMVGPAGAGKNTVMDRARQTLGDLRQFPTATTRPMRPNETPGKQHHFLSRAEFEALIAQDRLLEHQVVHGNLYGIPRDTLVEALEAGEDLVADIDMLGASRARTEFPHNTILVFVAPPSLPLLAERMRERGESQSEIAKRMLRAPGEMAFAPQCDYVIINDDLDRAVAEFTQVIAWERARRNARFQAAAWRPAEYIVRALVAHEGAVALAEAGDGGPPQMRFGAGDAPHLTAIAAAGQLGIVPPPSALSTSGDGAFVPPVQVEHVEGDTHDQFIYTYVFRLGQRAPLAAGWRWVELDEGPLEDVALSQLIVADGIGLA